MSPEFRFNKDILKTSFFTAENVLVCKLVSAIETCIGLADHFSVKQYRVIFGAHDINYIWSLFYDSYFDSSRYWIKI